MCAATRRDRADGLTTAIRAEDEAVIRGSRACVKLGAFVLGLLVAGCSSAELAADDDDGGVAAAGCNQHADCSGDTPRCDSETGDCVSKGPAHQIGWGDGTASTVAVMPVYQPEAAREAVDLEFHPTRVNELWVVMREFESQEPCSESYATEAGCLALEGSVAVIQNPGLQEVTWARYVDPNAWHFMRRPSALAHGAMSEICTGLNGASCLNHAAADWIGTSDTFATCHEARTGNFQDDPIDFIGPTLWPSDLEHFAKSPPGMNGSHLDMLHATPYCMGIAHERDNVYWTFNGKLGAVEQYNFNATHQIGGHDHSDGEIYRYVRGQLLRVPNVPSHMVFHQADQHLYIADTGNHRVVKLDPNSGVVAGALQPNYEEIEIAKVVEGAVLLDVVPPGILEAPSGLAIHDGLLFVTDTATSRIHAFELDGTLVRSLQLDVPAGTLAGFTFGPDDQLFFVDKHTATVYRIDPAK